ncbi:transcriptional repressor CTCF-like [Hyalella azteca]|uniref:Transcriptional repressor CTCF-like n=1 Tax=Hyalella azteca TaxID=294128 RepID=A0A979FSX5_HYAAZ|nr:transcriptional repressor CTCF-like [Hyalella azteca]
MEAPVVPLGAHPNSLQKISAPLLNQFGEVGSALASRDAAGNTDASEASCSKERVASWCSQHALAPAGVGQLPHHIDVDNSASGPHRFSENTSNSGIGLQQHINAMHSINKFFQLPDFEQSSTTRKSIQVLIDSKNSCRRKSKSRFCLNSCTNDTDLEQHICSQPPPRNAQKYSQSKHADGCKEVLHKHCLSKHLSVKKLCCSECDYACTTKRNLKSHLLRKHSMGKPLLCSICDYVCSSKYELKSHFVRRHSTENLFCALIGSLASQLTYKLCAHEVQQLEDTF